ncbi:MAG: glycosyltransferase family 4 protein [Candidatus Methanomethylicaceae archaeon]
MKIALIHTAFITKGGGERFLYEVFRRIKKDHEIHIFCNGISKESFNFYEFEHTVIPSRHDIFGKFVAYYEAKGLKEAIKHAVKWKPDIIWLNRGYYHAGWIIEKYNIKVISYVHYPLSLEPLKQDILHKVYRRIIGLERLEAESFAKVPLVLCNSKYTESAIKREQPKAKTEVVYPGVDHTKFFPTWEDEGYLYYNSRFQQIKNQKLAIEVARKTNYRLILSGFVSKNNLSYFEYIRNEAEKSNNIEIIPNPNDDTIIKLLQKCSIFLFPSIGEHFGIAPIEAMACGRPVIGHKSGGTIETVGKVGILCGNDVSEWVRNVKYLMENVDTRINLGKKAFEYSKTFTWENTANKISNILENIVKQK